MMKLHLHRQQSKNADPLTFQPPNVPLGFPGPTFSLDETLPGMKKLSAVLIELVEPYLTGEESLQDYQALYSLAGMAWNVAMLPPHDRFKFFQTFIAPLPNEAKWEMRSLFDRLIARKERLFADDQRFIERVDVIDEGGDWRVYVLSMVSLPEK